MVTSMFIGILPAILAGPTLIVAPGVAALAVANPVVWFDLVPTLMS